MSPKNARRHCSQLSLEYLLLLAGVLGIFAFLLPTLQGVYGRALFALDCKNAGQFSSSLQRGVDGMLFLADGSRQTLHAHPFTEWLVYSEGEKFFVDVTPPGGGAGKNFSAVFPNEIPFDGFSFSGEKDFLLEKTAGGIYLKTVS